MSILSTTEATFRRLNAELDAANKSGDIQQIHAALVRLTDFTDNNQFFGNSDNRDREVAWELLAALVQQIDSGNLRDEHERD